MVIRRKLELVKNINSTVSHTHGFKLRKIRTKEEETEGKSSVSSYKGKWRRDLVHTGCVGLLN